MSTISLLNHPKRSLYIRQSVLQQSKLTLHSKLIHSRINLHKYLSQFVFQCLFKILETCVLRIYMLKFCGQIKVKKKFIWHVVTEKNRLNVGFTCSECVYMRKMRKLLALW